MIPSASKLAFAWAILILPLLMSRTTQAQVALSGTVATSSGTAVPGATVVAKNRETGASASAQTDASGAYQLTGLVPGEYEVTVSASGFSTNTTSLTLKAGATETLALVLTGASTQGTENLPNAPSTSKTEPSLEDLGFPAETTKSDPKEQVRLDRRTHMLKIHQRLGLITTIPLVAAVVSSAGAGGKQTSTTSRNLHVGLGALAGDLYFTTAYFAIFAPKIAGTPTKGPIRVHKALAWIHGPGMIATPILGIIAFNQKSRGEKVHGFGAAHMPVAIVTAGAYGAALLSVSVKF